jgi:hypothetical protein
MEFELIENLDVDVQDVHPLVGVIAIGKVGPFVRAYLLLPLPVND